VIDGKYLTSAYFNFSNTSSTSSINAVPILIGVNRDEGGVLAPFFNTTDLDTGIRGIAASQSLNATAIIDSHLFPLGNGPVPSNQSLDVFNTTTRIDTDTTFRCSSQNTVYAGVRSGRLPTVYFYEFNRTYQDPGYDMNGVCQPPVTPSHPDGDPSLEYFKCHAGDLAFTFGNVARVGFPARDENDMPFTRLVVDYWTSFARQSDPNLDVNWLAARGYWESILQSEVAGQWPKVEASNPKMMELQWNSFVRGFRDEQQCEVLGLGLEKFE
jgi:carboxylesterase type B